VAVVVAARGGPALAAALDAAAWADDRVVLDLVGRSDTSGPVRVLRRVAELRDLGGAWIVLLDEAERLSPADGARLEDAVGCAGDRHVLSVRTITEGLALRVATGRSVRVGPPGVRVVLDSGMRVGLTGTGLRTIETDAVVTRARGAGVGEAVEQLDAEAAVLARLATSDGGIVATVWAPLVAGARLLGGRAVDGPLGLGRWILAVLEAYRVVVAQAKRWELRRNCATERA
jgi:hypothetical protein